MPDTRIEHWLRGPVNNVPALLQPVAHALLQARDEVEESLNDFPNHLLWEQPAGSASAGFHLQHLTGVLDRLFTYARGELLNERQLEYLASEGKPEEQVHFSILVERFRNEVDKAIEQLKKTPEHSLNTVRGVGRKQLPSTVAGLLFHAAEHTMRHTGQLLVTTRFIKKTNAGKSM